MLGASRLPAVGVFLVGVFLGASVCGAGRPAGRGADQGSRAIPSAAAYGPTAATFSTFPLIASMTTSVPFSRGDSVSWPEIDLPPHRIGK